MIVPPRIGIARSGCSYPLRTTTPTGVVDVARAGRWTLGDLFRVWGRRLGRSALLSFKGRVSVFVDGRRRAGDPRSARAHRARRGRARGGRLRDAASQLRVPERSQMIRRPLLGLLFVALLAGCGGSSSPTERADDPARTHLSARRLQARRHGRRRQADGRLVRDPAAERKAAHPLQARRRPAHRRASDHRPRRPRDDRAPAPADRRGRDGQARRSRSPKPGPYRVVVDAYPDTTGPAARTSSSSASSASRGTYVPQPLPPFTPTVDVGGYRFTLHGTPNLHAIQAGFLTVTVAGPHGQAGALHAVVRRARARDLLPAGLARLLPHPRLRPRRRRLHEHARRGRRSPAAPRRRES